MSFEKGIPIIFLKEITEDATGDHPDYLLAKKGQKGTIDYQRKFSIDGSQSNEWYNVYWEGWKSASFAAQINVEFKIIEE